MANETEEIRGDVAAPADASDRPRRRGIRAVLGVPLAIVSTVAVTLGIAQPAEAATPQVKRHAKAKAQGSAAHRTASLAAVAAAPAEYVVADGRHRERHRRAVRTRDGGGPRRERARLVEPDLPRPAAGAAAGRSGGRRRPRAAARRARRSRDTSSSRATPSAGSPPTYGLDVASVLSANGLGPSSLIFPGESIVPSPTCVAAPLPHLAPRPRRRPTGSAEHVVVDGDTLVATPAYGDRRPTAAGRRSSGQCSSCAGRRRRHRSCRSTTRPAPTPGSSSTSGGPSACPTRASSSPSPRRRRSRACGTCTTATSTPSGSSSSGRARAGAHPRRCSTPCGRRPRSTSDTAEPSAGGTLGLLDIAGWESMTRHPGRAGGAAIRASRSLREVGGAGTGLAVGAGLSRAFRAAPARGIRHHEAVAIPRVPRRLVGFGHVRLRRLECVTTAPADPMIGRLVDGRYQVRSRIARGGMATVYLATDLGSSAASRSRSCTGTSPTTTPSRRASCRRPARPRGSRTPTS